MSNSSQRPSGPADDRVEEDSTTAASWRIDVRVQSAVYLRLFEVRVQPPNFLFGAFSVSNLFLESGIRCFQVARRSSEET